MTSDSAVAPARSTIVLRRTRPAAVANFNPERTPYDHNTPARRAARIAANRPETASLPGWLKQPHANDMAVLLREAKDDMVAHGWGEVFRRAALMSVGTLDTTSGQSWHEVAKCIDVWAGRMLGEQHVFDWLQSNHTDVHGSIWTTYGHTGKGVYFAKWLDHLIAHLVSVE